MKIKDIFIFVLQCALFQLAMTSLTNQSITNLAQVSQTSNVINTATIQVPNPPVIDLSSKFIQTSLLGNDVGVGPEGDIYFVGIDGKLYIYNFATASYSRVIADPDLDGLTRVDVDDEGTQFIVTIVGLLTIYHVMEGGYNFLVVLVTLELVFVGKFGKLDVIHGMVDLEYGNYFVLEKKKNVIGIDNLTMAQSIITE